MSEVSRAFRFALAGIVGFLVDAGVLFLVIGVAGPYWSRAISFVGAVATTWALNRRHAFADRASGQHPAAEFASYLAAMLIGGAVNYTIYASIVAAAGAEALVPYLGVAAGSLAGMVVNLGLARFAIFRHQREIH